MFESVANLRKTRKTSRFGRRAREVASLDARSSPPFWFARSEKPLWAQGRVGGECVSCNCISSVVIWTQFVCFWALLFFFAHCRDMKRAVHKQNHVTRGFCRSGGADVSLPRRTAPVCSWTLYNRTWARDGTTTTASCPSEADMWLLN